MANATFALFVPEHGSGALRIGYTAVNDAVNNGITRECVCGGSLAVCDCGAITCTDARCDLPRAFTVQTYGGTYYQPAEYEDRCTACSMDPDEGPDPDYERDMMLEAEYEDRY